MTAAQTRQAMVRAHELEKAQQAQEDFWTRWHESERYVVPATLDEVAAVFKWHCICLDGSTDERELADLTESFRFRVKIVECA